MNNTISIFFVTAALSISTSVAQAQTCISRENSSAHPQFVTNTDGTTKDLSTGLTWSRCLVGQTLSNGKCAGEPRTFELRELLSFMDKLALSTLDDKYQWRLPNIKELASLVDRQCANPAIRIDAFPHIPQKGGVWSNTHDLTIILESGQIRPSGRGGFAIGGVTGGSLGYSKNFILLVAE